MYRFYIVNLTRTPVRKVLGTFIGELGRKDQLQLQNSVGKEEKKLFDDDATDITEANCVYENWDKIVENLTDHRMS